MSEPKTFSTQDLTRRTYGAAQATDEVMLALDAIRLDGGTQPRAEIDTATIQRYAEAMMNGDQFPAVEVMYDGEDYWLVDGFHRDHAARLLGKDHILAKVRQGTQRDAQLASVGVNAKHGLPRTADDIRRAVLRLLEDREWGQWSDREIARQCGVSHPTVAKLRRELSGNRYQIDAAEAEREPSGNRYQMEAQPAMTPERRERLAQLLSQPANEAMDALAGDMSLTRGDLHTLLNLEYEGRRRPSVRKFITDAIIEESRTAPGAAQPTPAATEPDEDEIITDPERLRQIEHNILTKPLPPQTRTVQRGGQTYQQAVSSEKRSQAAQARQPAPKPSAAPAPAPHYADKPRVGVWRIRDEGDWIAFSDRMMDLLQQGEPFEIEVRMA